jgi:hypothetical protein
MEAAANSARAMTSQMTASAGSRRRRSDDRAVRDILYAANSGTFSNV